MGKEMNAADALAGIATATLPVDDPDRLVYEWMAQNASNLRAATAALGVTVEEGPGFGERLFAAVRDALSPTRPGGGERGG